ncbi:MAG: SPOR domain-containing protein [Bacteroidales bacterium]|nr:SPOR domain-containing protein [Bacteroidales bacterium]
MIHYITKGLQENESIYVNDLGTFTKHYVSARIDGDTLLPPHYEVSLDTNIDHEEIIFTNLVCRERQCMLTQANAEILQWVDELKQALSNNKSVTFEGFGTFSLVKGDIHFESETIEGLNLEFEGMKALSLIPGAVPPMEEDDYTPEPVEEPAPVVEPEPEPVVEPTPVTIPVAAPVEELEEVPVSIAEPQPAEEPEPVIQYSHVVDEEPKTEPTEEPTAAEEPAPVVEPEPEPVVEPTPVTIPVAAPVEEMEEEPVSIAEPEHVEEPEPVIQYSHVADEEPQTDTIEEPAAAEEPASIAEPQPAEEPEPVEEPLAVKEPEPVEEPESDEETDTSHGDDDPKENTGKRKRRIWPWILLLLLLAAAAVLFFILRQQVMDILDHLPHKRSSDQVIESQPQETDAITLDDSLYIIEPEEVDTPAVYIPDTLRLTADKKYPYIQFEQGHFYVIAGSFQSEKDVETHIRQTGLAQYSPTLVLQDGVKNIRICIGIYPTEEEAQAFIDSINKHYWVLK